MVDILQGAFPNAFSLMETFDLQKNIAIYSLGSTQALVQIMARPL